MSKPIIEKHISKFGTKVTVHKAPRKKAKPKSEKGTHTMSTDTEDMVKARDVVKFFGDHMTALAMLLHLAVWRFGGYVEEPERRGAQNGPRNGR